MAAACSRCTCRHEHPAASSTRASSRRVVELHRGRGIVEPRELLRARVDLQAVIAEAPFDESRWDVVEDFFVDRGRAGIVAAQQTGDPIELAKAYARPRVDADYSVSSQSSHST